MNVTHEKEISSITHTDSNIIFLNLFLLLMCVVWSHTWSWVLRQQADGANEPWNRGNIPYKMRDDWVRRKIEPCTVRLLPNIRTCSHYIIFSTSTSFWLFLCRGTYFRRVWGHNSFIWNKSQSESIPLNRWTFDQNKKKKLWLYQLYLCPKRD